LKRFGIDYDNSIESNRSLWSRHEWVRGGDEWDGQAVFLGIPYEEWKRALVDEFITSSVTADMTVLEIAAGHGRWSEQLLPLCKRLILVDLNSECIETCRKKFSASTNIEYIVTDGKSLPSVADASVDFIWSFDSFVHMDPTVIQAYFGEMSRVLSPSGKAVIHHAGRNDRWLWLGRIRNYGMQLRTLYTWISMGTWRDHDGWRSNVSPELIGRLAASRGLALASQTRYWGENAKYGVPRFRDMISVLHRSA